MSGGDLGERSGDGLRLKQPLKCPFGFVLFQKRFARQFRKGSDQRCHVLSRRFFQTLDRLQREVR